MIFYFSKTKDETVDLFKWLDENIPEWRTEEWSNQERNNDCGNVAFMVFVSR